MTTNATSPLVPVEHADSYDLTRFNAVKHGILSRHILLPWENADEYSGLLARLVAEHQPDGPTEEHLVEEIAGVMWRKQRLRLPEAAAHRRGLRDAAQSFRDTADSALAHTGGRGEQTFEVLDAVAMSSDDVTSEIQDLDEDEAMTRRAVKLLQGIKRDAYNAACRSLRQDTREWWERVVSEDPDDVEDEQEAYTQDRDGLLRFLEAEVVPWLENRRQELEHQPLVRIQALGESLDPDRLERLGRYEVHLDRKLERTLSMLIRLRDIRRASSVPAQS